MSDLKPLPFEPLALIAKLEHLKNTDFDINLLFNDQFYLDILRSFPDWKQVNIIQNYKLNPQLKPKDKI